MKIGILGGTFNPIHVAHLRIAEEVADRCGLDRILFMPAAAPPHKPLAGELPFAARLEMVRLAVADNPRFAVSSLEGEREGKSYSIDSLRALRSQFPHDELSFIIGSDSFLEIGSWREYEAIFAACNLVVVERPEAVITALDAALPVAIAGEFCYHEPDMRLTHSSGCSVQYVRGVPLPISSSLIRTMVHKGYSVRYLTPDPVVHYIKEQRLYADAY